MSFNITLARNDSDRSVLSKSVTALETLSGTLRDGCSLLDPVILIEHQLNSSLEAANYAYISAFGRSYFITDLKSIRSGLIVLTLHVDVLSTYSTLIRSNSALIDKAESGGNRYLNDGTFRRYSYSTPETIAFPSSLDTSTAILVTAGTPRSRVET